MSAFVIFIREQTTDQTELNRYLEVVGSSSVGRSMKALVRNGAFEMIEGEPMEGVIMIEFADMAEARAWLDSPLYQAAAVHRRAGARSRAFIVEGIS